MVPCANPVFTFFLCTVVDKQRLVSPTHLSSFIKHQSVKGENCFQTIPLKILVSIYRVLGSMFHILLHVLNNRKSQRSFATKSSMKLYKTSTSQAQ